MYMYKLIYMTCINNNLILFISLLFLIYNYLFINSEPIIFMCSLMYKML